MKKLTSLLAISVLGLVMFFSSCTKDEEVPPSNLKPSINFIVESGYVYEDVTLDVNSTFKIKVFAQENGVSGANLQSIKITRIFALDAWDTTLTFNQSSYTLDATFTGKPIPGNEKIEFEVTDKDNQQAMISLVITYEPATGNPIFTYSMKILGSYDSQTGSSFASIDGTVYTQQNAFANQANIDFLYWWGNTTHATLGAPDDANAALVFTNATYGLQNWTIKNATRFKTTTLSVDDFDAITDSNPLIANATGADQSHLGSLEVDDVVAFVTVDDHHGLIRVREIVPGADGEITIDVKVEEYSR